MYCVFDGCDGCGKDTQADLLCMELRIQGLDPLRVNEPDMESPIGKLLRSFLKTGEYRESHAALFLADRLALHYHRILPALEQGRPVVSSRSFLSTLVYQQENWDLDRLFSMHLVLPAKIDQLFILDVDPKEAAERLGRRATAPEYYERLDIQVRNRKRYLDLARDPRLDHFVKPGGIHVVAAGDIANVRDSILTTLEFCK